ncbi:MAG: thioredoxin family protein [Planctomycetota bacterium]
MLALPALLLLPLTLLNPLQEGESQPKKPARTAIYDEQADGEALVTAALENARLHNRRVLIQWGANWCGWCHRLHDLFEQDRAVHAELIREYDLVLLDVGKRDRNLDLAEKYGVDLKNGLPYLTVLDAEGKVVTHQETGALESTDEKVKGHDKERVLAFLRQHRVEGRTAKQYLNGALARSRTEGKNLFLHFGADWCGNCRQLERWLADPDVAPLMERNFIELKIDTETTRGGRKLLDRTRTGEPGGIPWFAFFGQDGELAVDSNRTSDGKNVGYPKKPEDAAHFRKMLEAAGPGLKPEEIDTLIEALARY